LIFWRQVYTTNLFDAFIYKAADERLNSISTQEKKDFMYWFTDAGDAETGDTFTMEELVEEGILLVTAGE
jgi:cytochrome P450